MAQFANANRPPYRCSRNLRRSLGSGWRRPGIRSVLHRLTGIGKTSEVMSAEKIFLAYNHGLSPRGSSPSPPIPPSPKSYPSFHFYCAPPTTTTFFSQIIPLCGKPGLKISPAWKNSNGGRGGRLMEGYLGKGVKQRAERRIKTPPQISSLWVS